MAIATNKNTSYGTGPVTQKYSPLLGIQYSRDQRIEYSRLLTNRSTILRASHVLPRQLILAVPDWTTAIRSEAGRKPPLVVISSNRSSWISGGLTCLDRELASRGLERFDTPSDLRALEARDSRTTISPPIYGPKRMGTITIPGTAPGTTIETSERNVYIVVHAYEYQTYLAALDGFDHITVVGWGFLEPTATQARTGRFEVEDRRLTGFGASRFAAIEFCKQLRTLAAGTGAAPWDVAWLFDDNVVALTNFPGYTKAETALLAAGGPRACMGFKGGAAAEGFTATRKFARDEVAAGQTTTFPDSQRGKEYRDLPTAATTGLVQQAALWNIAYLTANDLNFGPIYVASGEDVSFAAYFDAQSIPYLYYDGIKVRKEVGAEDNSEGARKVNDARRRLMAWITDVESADAAEGADTPPPVMVRPPTDAGDGGEQKIGTYIVDRVLPASRLAEERDNAATQARAKCQAVEQITCGAIKGGHVTTEALTSTFKINGVLGTQDVRRANLPRRP